MNTPEDLRSKAAACRRASSFRDRPNAYLERMAEDYDRLADELEQKRTEAPADMGGHRG